jgi:hypothetical protein
MNRPAFVAANVLMMTVTTVATRRQNEKRRMPEIPAGKFFLPVVTTSGDKPNGADVLF